MILNATIVVVALPAIQDDLGIDSADLMWVVTAYLLTFGGFLLLGGRSADLFGHRRTFITGMAIFTAASLIASLATSPAVFLTARAVQGLGAAAVVPTTLAIVIVAFPDGQERRRALSIWTAIGAMAGSATFILGGLLASVLSWAAVFMLNVPMGVLIIVAALRWIQDPLALTPGRLDLIGGLTITCGSAALLLALSNGKQNGWLDVLTLTPAGAAVILILAFIAVERTRPAPLIRIGIFGARRLVVATLTISAISGTMMGAYYLTTLYFQRVLEFSPFSTGLAFLPPAISVSIASLITPWLLRRISASLLLPASLLILGAGLALLTRMGISSEYSTSALPALALMSLGVGCAGVTVGILVTSNLPEAHVGQASGLIATSREIGGGIWLAGLAAVATAEAATATSENPAVALISGQRHALWFATVVVALIATAALMLLRVKRRRP